MKTIYTQLLGALAALLLLTSCEKDEIRAILKPDAVPVATLSSQNLVLTKDNAEQDALTISWPAPNYGFNAAATYTVLLDKKGGDFSKAESVVIGTDLKKTFKGRELNNLLLKLGLVPGTAADVDVKVQSTMGASTTLSSVLKTVKVTPFLDRIDLSTNWGLVGSATTNGWDGPDMPFYKTDKANVFVAYVTLRDGEIKFRQDNKWDVNYGGTGGTAEKGGGNIAVKAGTYRITFDLNGLKYTVEPYSLGLVGDATPNGWGDKPDTPLIYDPTSDTWKAVIALTNKSLKIRLNNDWAVNYGDKGADGVLDAGGDNIAIPAAGTYLVTVDFKTMKYTVEVYKAWGVVGSATPNGWDGPDAKFIPTGVDKVFYLDAITLKAGEIKFRFNDAWDVNYGDKGNDGILETGGDNIVVKAGTYSITLDLSNASRPTYTMSKK